MTHKKNTIDTSIQNVQDRMAELEAQGLQTDDKYLELIEVRNRLESIRDLRKKSSLNANVVADIGGKLLISGAVLAIEKSGVLTTKVPIASLIQFKK